VILAVFSSTGAPRKESLPALFSPSVRHHGVTIIGMHDHFRTPAIIGNRRPYRERAASEGNSRRDDSPFGIGA
jgi:hypothetical protein